MDIQRVQDNLLKWYWKNALSFPWRDDPTPYHIWISEIMLQQTRIEAALPYYNRFLQVLPDVLALADVSQDELLKLWEGLGYYSRAKNLQKAAQVIVRDYGGHLPSDYRQLLSLPGIGEYTAGAIASIAFNIPVPAVDGNVMRVLARLTNDNTDVLSGEGKKHYTHLAQQLVPVDHPGDFNQALMELGETVCLPNTIPCCDKCPLRDCCEAFRAGTAAVLPVRIKKTTRRIEARSVLLVIREGEPKTVLVHRRDETGLLAGLWEFPNTVNNEPLSCIPAVLADKCRFGGELPSSKHLFSHIEWQMRGFLYYVDSDVKLPDNYQWATVLDVEERYSIPGAFQKYKKTANQLLKTEC